MEKAFNQKFGPLSLPGGFPFYGFSESLYFFSIDVVPIPFIYLSIYLCSVFLIHFTLTLWILFITRILFQASLSLHCFLFSVSAFFFWFFVFFYRLRCFRHFPIEFSLLDFKVLFCLENVFLFLYLVFLCAFSSTHCFRSFFELLCHFLLL